MRIIALGAILVVMLIGGATAILIWMQWRDESWSIRVENRGDKTVFVAGINDDYGMGHAVLAPGETRKLTLTNADFKNLQGPPDHLDIVVDPVLSSAEVPVPGTGTGLRCAWDVAKSREPLVITAGFAGC
jgi:hypothetical protein